MAKRQRLSGPGIVLDRSAKKGKLKFAFDCSPDAFVTECRREKGRLKVTFTCDEMEPIEVLAAGKLWAFELEDAAVPPAAAVAATRRITAAAAGEQQTERSHRALERDPTARESHRGHDGKRSLGPRTGRKARERMGPWAHCVRASLR